MALQDLTPNLRTRLNRVEHVVGVFVLLAVVLLLGGFCYYVWYTAKNKGWFEPKAPFSCLVDSANGLAVGQPVKMMGFDAGEITEITPVKPGDWGNVTVKFVIKGKYIGYMWTDSTVRLGPGDILGKRSLEVLKGGWRGAELNPDGTTIHEIYTTTNNRITKVVRQLDSGEWRFEPWTPDSEAYFMGILEEQALTERASSIIGMEEGAMPDILGLTNQVMVVLDSADTAVSNLNRRIVDFEPLLTNFNAIVAGFKPTSTNVSIITANLTNANGGLGNWLLPTNLNNETKMTLQSLRETMSSARIAISNASEALIRIDTTVGNTDTNLSSLMEDVSASLKNVASITSNLNAQVTNNTNILGEVSQAVKHTDEFVQGMKKFWLFRSTFKKKK